MQDVANKLDQLERRNVNYEGIWHVSRPMGIQRHLSVRLRYTSHGYQLWVVRPLNNFAHAHSFDIAHAFVPIVA